MFTLAIVVISFTAIQLIVASANFIFKPVLRDEGNQDYLISVLIPARNEEKNIRIILNDLISQPYLNLEIIVFDDQSDDLTASIVQELAKSDHRIKLVRSEFLPDGWLGKNFACHSMALLANGEYFLFLDADVRISDNILGLAVAYAAKNKPGLLSFFPRQILVSAGEKITVPTMNYILLTLLPLPMVLGSGFASMAAANGQFMLFNAQTYRNFNLHEQHKKNKVEDISIARFLKRNRIPVACLTGTESIQCRMYEGFGEALTGFSKNIIAFFGNSFSAAILFWLITTFGFIPVFLALHANIFIGYLVAILLIRLLVSIVSYQPIWINLLYLIPQQLTIGLFIVRAFTGKYLNKYQWKGRNIT